jgi:hypothetical protein
MQSVEQAAAAGGPSTLPALLSAGAAALGANSLSAWLAARGLSWATPRRLQYGVWLATSAVLLVALLVVT